MRAGLIKVPADAVIAAFLRIYRPTRKRRARRSKNLRGALVVDG
jgi:hypothetical protein